MNVQKKFLFFEFWAEHLTYLAGILGDSAPSDRQVSPEKLIRAAMLRKRFADTILKAREKALLQVGYKFGLPVNLNVSVSAFF